MGKKETGEGKAGKLGEVLRFLTPLETFNPKAVEGGVGGSIWCGRPNKNFSYIS
jgi:hypothetical protein